MNLLIKNGTVLLKGEFKSNMDVYIENEKIKAIDKNIEKEAFKIIDATGCFVIPGLVDMHCQISEPGYEYNETFESGSLSAAKGGFTSITINPDTYPTIDNKAVVEFITSKGKTESKVNIFPYGSMTKKCEGKDLAEIGDMQLSGVVAISDGDKAIQDANLMSKIIKYTNMFDITIITHCEENLLSFNSGINEGKTSTLLGLKGAIRTAEEIMVSRNLILAKYYNAPIHIPHISTKESVELIRQAKKNGVNVTAETSPHYFILNEKAVLEYNTLTKVNPPLRTEKDRVAIIEAIKDGTIDVISSDHKPSTIDLKSVEFENASFGISALETAFPLAYTELVSKGVLTLEKLLEKMSKNPSKILGLNKGTIKTGADADIVIVKPEKNSIDSSQFLSKAKYSPFDNYLVDIKIQNTIVNGVEVDIHLK
ncbi:dihydroorotase [Natranaerovirga hydrolytica]|uniref:Dihydroorotase n=1 Tax=Natranaerovirga hydrolytica TaxID=680378 RepID=A0A4R1N660_9FIRM|nr:dihydroorotase [Natranaerovirga hydrolytica]TCK98113.1 dihydroorotase [Natranaerovirga hydrolytica]